MILDDTLVLSEAQTVVATGASTNIIDLGAAGTPWGATNAVRRDIGIGTEIPVLVTIMESYNGNLPTLQITIQVDDDPAFGSPTAVATSPVYPAADITIGKQIRFPAELPQGVNERYLRFLYTVGFTTTAPTTGKITAAIVAGRQTN